MLYILSYLLSLFDLFATLRLVKKYGVDVEGNPLGRWLLAHPVFLYVYKIGIVGVGIFILWMKQDLLLCQVGIWIVFIVYLLIFLYHLYIIFRLKK